MTIRSFVPFLLFLGLAVGGDRWMTRLKAAPALPAITSQYPATIPAAFHQPTLAEIEAKIRAMKDTSPYSYGTRSYREWLRFMDSIAVADIPQALAWLD